MPAEKASCKKGPKCTVILKTSGSVKTRHFYQLSKKPFMTATRRTVQYE
ncbi:hypothetical protein GEOBRER4_n2805 [Citrifermentans bremense]|uniref:Uncharacterized protein n=1 Tax=Citrifermentans bremense TaxID=60035 RepID=A0A7R7FT07_9BACT|nr:hypothetical protein GEOBRER4_n2805 [Citrifermentans bremense]